MDSVDQRTESSWMGHLAWGIVMMARVPLIDTPLI